MVNTAMTGCVGGWETKIGKTWKSCASFDRSTLCMESLAINTASQNYSFGFFTLYRMASHSGHIVQALLLKKTSSASSSVAEKTMQEIDLVAAPPHH